MQTTDRARVAILSLLLLSVSCAVPPTASLAPAPPTVFSVDRDPPPEVVRAESEALARALGERDTGLPPAAVTHLARVITEEAHRAGLSPAFVLAVIDVESSGRNFAVSNVGARGLMQIRPATAEFVSARIGVPWRGAATLFDPALNVRLGIHYLAHMLERYPDVPTALAAYNWGPSLIAGRLQRGEPIPREYANRVLASFADRLREI